MVAQIKPDPYRPGSWTVRVDGAEQSHVDRDPTHLEYPYQRWLRHVVEVLAPASVLHLGGGGLTLPRYLAATRGPVRQRVVELDATLSALVADMLPPLPGIELTVGDARDGLGGLAERYDLIVTDVFAGPQVPAHIGTVEFVRLAAAALAPAGSFCLNLADGPPLAYARAQAATVRAVFPATCLIAHPSVLRGRRFGNVVLLGGDRLPPLDVLGRRLAAEVFPARLLDGRGLARFIGDATAVTDATARPSPLPPRGPLARWGSGAGAGRPSG